MDATHQPTSGSPGLDLPALAEHLRRVRPDLVGVTRAAELVAGGKSNLTYRLTGPDRVVVLRRPPLGHVLPTAHDMAREYRVIAALHPTGFPVPAPLYLCQDESVIGAPFYLMSYVDGRVLRGAEEIDCMTPLAARRVSEVLVDTLADLHAIDPATVGLGDFGHPDGFLDRQVRRWYAQWQHSKTRELSTLDDVATQLGLALPGPGRSAIVHGDYRLDNVLVDQEATRILAVLDWEMATLGDPLCDLGLLVVYTQLAAEGLAPTQPRLGPEQGFLPAADLVAWYLSRTPLTEVALGWYVALGYFKLAIVSEGIHARYLLGKTVGAGFERMGASVPALVDRAKAALAAS
jgi:aminoglycoside phosphotransferase (APT) family kinase protein